jgi:putative (di)nucleoside polyphosphate hydrolase
MPDTSTLPYRPCVGIMLINPQGLVWIGKRAPSGGVAANYCWQLPQGGIDAGEDPQAAALRELYEETSVRSVSLMAEAPGWLHYDYPPEVRRNPRTAKYRGQKQKWFALRFEGDESEINVLSPPDGQKAEFCDWRWTRAAELPELIIPFKRKVYEGVVTAFSAITA